MNLFRFPEILATTAAAALLAGCGKAGKQAGGPPHGGPVAVAVITIKTQPVEPTTELTGRVAASLTAEVRPQVGGILLKRLFTEGTDVKAGEVLYEIDPAPLQASYNGAKAALAKAEANVEPLRLKFERYAGLLASDAVSRQDYEDAEASYKLSQAEVGVAKAALETARINLEYTKVTAPISGRIGRSAVTDGALVTANQSVPLATIQRLNPVFVDVTQSDQEMLRLRRALESGQLIKSDDGNKVTLTLDDGSKYPQTGLLKFSEAFVDPGTGSVTLRTSFPNPELLLLPGMFVRAVLTEGIMKDGILVPQRAVTRNPAGDALVALANDKNQAEIRIIKVSQTIGDSWLVTSGLKPGDRVIMEGIQRVRPGVPLLVTPFVEGAAPAPPPAKDAKDAPAHK